MAATQDRHCCAIEHGQAFSQAGPASVMPILIPPAVFGEEVAVLDLPVVAHGLQQPGRGDTLGGDAGDKVACIVRNELALSRQHVAIHAHGDVAVRHLQTFTNILGVVEVQPQPATIFQAPLFSQVSAAGGR